MNPIRERIMASAGTGKTFTLAGRFLKLLFQEVPPAEILATTFTRKAAGEILERVLGWLANAELADSPDPDLQQIGERALADLRKATELGEEINPQRCRTLLAGLIQNLDTFNVRTLDSFFVESAKVFALELGLPLDWEIVDDHADGLLRSEALSQLLGPQQQVEVFGLLNEMTAAGPGRAVHESSLKVVRQSLDIYRDSAKSAWQVIQPEEKPYADDRWQTLLESLEALKSPTTAKGTPTQSFEKLKPKIQELLMNRSWVKLLENGFVQKVLAGEDKYSTKEIPEAWKSVVGQISTGAIATVISELARRNEALYEFLERFDQSYAQIKITQKSFRFEDFSLALAKHGGIGGSGVGKHEGAFFRLNRTIQHLLLDEFQDTSVTQWRVLAPLVERVLGREDRSFFCVGDAKQSIYGWREGEPRLLQDLVNWYGDKNIQEDELNLSYRSSPAIMKVVNKVFENLKLNPALEDEDLENEASQWGVNFKEHKSFHKKVPGSVRFSQVEEWGNAEETRAACIALAAERVEALHQEAPTATIGILVRRKNWIPALLYRLQERGVRASGEGGNPLVDSREVLAVLSLFHFVDHSGDTAALFHVGDSFLADAFGLSTEEVPEKQRHALAAKIRRELLQEGYGPWLTQLMENHAADVDDWGARRLRQLVDLGHIFDRRAGLRPSAFVDMVRTTPVEDPSAANIKVMTIHASKGLEFDAVVLPELVTKWKGGSPNLLLTQRPDPKESFQLVTHPVTKKIGGIHPEMERSYEAWRRREFSEMMCLLYVAMTRAKLHLELIGPQIKETKDGKNLGNTFADLLRGALNPDLDCEDQILWQHQHGNQPWHDQLEVSSAAEETAAVPAFALAPSAGPRMLPRSAPSSLGVQAVSAEQLLSGQGTEARRHGTLVHALFENVTWIDDFAMSQEELMESLAKYPASEEQKQKAVATFLDSLTHPRIKTILSKPEGNPEIDVFQEWEFKTIIKGKDGKESLMRGSIDRLVLTKENGKLTHAAIFDFKTDAVTNDEDLKRQTRHHQPQMDAYQAAVCNLLNLSTEKIETRLLFVS